MPRGTYTLLLWYDPMAVDDLTPRESTGIAALLSSAAAVPTIVRRDFEFPLSVARTESAVRSDVT